MADDDRRLVLEEIGHRLVWQIDKTPDRSGLRDTPRRFAKMWLEFLAAGRDDNCSTAFALDLDSAAHERDSGMVVVSGVRVFSFCEHHILPFWADITAGYIPTDKILGLSKFARIARKHAAGLQVQERLTADIAAELHGVTDSEDVAVYASGVHLCTVMRGVKAQPVMHTSIMHGLFREAQVKTEFLSIARQAAEQSRTI